MKYLTREVKIGIAGVVALALVFLGINFLRGINLFKPSNYFFIEFSNAKGLSKSSPVATLRTIMTNWVVLLSKFRLTMLCVSRRAVLLNWKQKF